MTHNGSAASPTTAISRHLAERIGHHTFDMWFGDTTKLHVNGTSVRVATESSFVADWINVHFRDDLQDAARDALGHQARVDLEVAPDLFSAGTPASTARRGRTAWRAG